MEIKIAQMCHKISWTKQYHKLLSGGEKKTAIEKLYTFLLLYNFRKDNK